MKGSSPILIALIALAAGPAAAQQAPQQRLVPGLWIGPSYDTHSRETAPLDHEAEGEVPSDPAAPPDLPTGAEVLGRDGVLLGHIAGVAQGEDTGQWFAVIRNEDHGLRALSAQALSRDEAGRVLSDVTPYQFRRLPEIDGDEARDGASRRRGPSM